MGNVHTNPLANRLTLSPRCWNYLSGVLCRKIRQLFIPLPGGVDSQRLSGYKNRCAYIVIGVWALFDGMQSGVWKFLLPFLHINHATFSLHSFIRHLWLSACPMRLRECGGNVGFYRVLTWYPLHIYDGGTPEV